MAERITGPSLFFGAIGDLLRHPGMALRIAVLPLALFLAVEAYSTLQFVAWYNEITSPNPPFEAPAALAFYVLVGLIAVAWHRFMILGEGPSIAALPNRLGNLWRYTIGWIVIGIVVGLGAFFCVVLPVFVIGSLLDQAFGETVAVVLGGPISGAVASQGVLTYVLLVIGVVLLLLFYMYAIFRVSMGLPAVAVDAERAPGLRASWRRTRPMAGAILILALLALVVQGAALGLQFWIFSIYPEGPLTFGFEFTRRVAAAVTDTVNTMVGAAILTRIYRATQDTAPDGPPPL